MQSTSLASCCTCHYSGGFQLSVTVHHSNVPFGGKQEQSRAFGCDWHPLNVVLSVSAEGLTVCLTQQHLEQWRNRLSTSYGMRVTLQDVWWVHMAAAPVHSPQEWTHRRELILLGRDLYGADRVLQMKETLGSKFGPTSFMFMITAIHGTSRPPRPMFPHDHSVQPFAAREIVEITTASGNMKRVANWYQLISVSPYFLSMYQSGCKEVQEGRIILEETDDVAEEIIRWMIPEWNDTLYDAEAKLKLNWFASTTASTWPSADKPSQTTSRIIDLFSAAERYQLERMKIWIVSGLVNTMSTSTAQQQEPNLTRRSSVPMDVLLAFISDMFLSEQDPVLVRFILNYLKMRLRDRDDCRYFDEHVQDLGPAIWMAITRFWASNDH